METFRPSWDDYFMAIARIIATRATCDRAHVGALLVKDKRIISTGYNGAPPGLPHCEGPDGHLMEEGHCIRTLHAEENTLLQVAFTGGTSTVGSTLYTTHSPCYQCAKKLIMAGVKRIVAGKHFSNTLPIDDALRTAGVDIVFYESNPEWDARITELFRQPIGTNTH